MNEMQNNDFKKEIKSSKKGLYIILGIIFLAIIAWGINSYFTNRNEQKLSDFFVTSDVIAKDFVNKERKEKSDAIPPADYVERFMGYINISKNAVETGVPSKEQFKDLSEDYLNIAVNYSILGDYDQSEEWYLKMLQEFPDDYKANMNLGDLYILMGQFKMAAEKFLDVVNLYPNDYRIYSKFADLYRTRSVAEDKLEKASEIYKFAVKNADNPRELYKEYAFFLENYVKDYEGALEMEREYQKITGSKEQQEIDRLQKMIK